MMKRSLKMGMLALVGVCVVFYQYHLSTGIQLDQLADTLPLVADLEPDGGMQKFSEEAIRTAVRTILETNGLSPDIGTALTTEIFSQLSKSSVVTHEKESASHIRIGEAESSPVTEPVFQTPAVCRRGSDEDDVPLYIITPTYRRPEQIPELTRLSHVLMLVRNVHWLVIEDAKKPTMQVAQLLNSTGLKYDHLIAPMPDQYQNKRGPKPRGVSNRNRGLQWLRKNVKDGVFYFADDDNTYDIKIFDEIRKTKKVSMFPVGLCTKFGLSTPVVLDGKFTGFYDGWVGGRKFPVDMAGFAVNVKFLHERPNASMPYRPGYEEDGFLQSLAPFERKDIELLADNCTRVLVWHTQSKKNEPSTPLDTKKYASTNLILLKQQIV